MSMVRTIILFCFIISYATVRCTILGNDSKNKVITPTPTFTTFLNGCLGEPINSDRDQKRNFLPDTVWTEIKGDTLIAHHHLIHNCCHRVSIAHEGIADTLIVRETFTGQTCRCICESDLDLTFGNISNGTYRLVILSTIESKTDTVFDKFVNVLY